MHALKTVALAGSLSALILSGCGESEAGDDGAAPDTSSTAPAETSSAAPGLPATLFATESPGDAVSLAEAKAGVAKGDSVVFEARIGGSRAPFVKDRAVFSVVDSSLQSCDQLHGDTCKTPWDYCCEPRDSLLAHMATVQITDGGGRPLQVSLEGEHGLTASRTIVVRGMVNEVSEAGVFVVNAQEIFVKEG